MAPLFGELSPQATERFRHNYTVSLIKMQSHRGHLGKLLFKRMAELGGVQAADQLDPGALHHKTFMGQESRAPISSSEASRTVSRRRVKQFPSWAMFSGSPSAAMNRHTSCGSAYGDWSAERAASRRSG